MTFLHCRQVHQRSVHGRIPPSPRKSQRTVPRKDNMEYRVKQPTGQRQKVDIWRAIAKEVRTLGVHNRRGTHCRKRWEDIRRGTRKTAESLLGMASQPRRGASRTLTPLMSRILAVVYPDLDGREQTQGASSGGGELAPEHEGAATHKAPMGHGTDTEATSDTEGEESFTTGTRGDTSDTTRPRMGAP
ncbi:hypothetical protein NDU88_001947 [Pleurodeles waltl]|uniref:Myb/SANT-like DNA-binding domain-containing protein n=1 Tax=Pleurodeles waltl TaxID=8319 RepID=A0AAV7LCV1_PLEWA|nr:hypothetical protein NDU88_001947 [Pleurodeles waltl]